MRKSEQMNGLAEALNCLDQNQFWVRKILRKLASTKNLRVSLDKEKAVQMPAGAGQPLVGVVLGLLIDLKHFALERLKLDSSPVPGCVLVEVLLPFWIVPQIHQKRLLARKLVPKGEIDLVAHGQLWDLFDAELIHLNKLAVFEAIISNLLHTLVEKDVAQLQLQ